MNNINWRPTQGASGGPVGDPAMEVGDWRAQLPADARPRIVNKITEILKRRVPFSGHEGLQQLKKIVARFEEKVYTAATSESDYIKRISFKMTGSQNPMPEVMQANNGLNPLDPGSMASGHQAPSISDTAIDNVSSGGREGAPSMESGDWRVQMQPASRERILNKIMETLKRHSPSLFSDEEALRLLMKIAMRFEEKIYTTATSQSDYLRKISLKMLTLPDATQANNGLNLLDPAQVKRETVEDARHFENEERMTRYEERMSRIEEQQACILALLKDLDRPSQPPVATTSAPVTTLAPVSSIRDILEVDSLHFYC